MQSNIAKSIARKIARIISELGKINGLPKVIIKYGARLFLTMLAVGSLLIVLNHIALGYDNYLEFVAMLIIKSSFTVLAEVIIGALIIDYFMRRM